MSITLGIPVGELRDRVTSAEFQEYRAYYSTEPFGDLRADFRTGILAAIVQNLFLGKTDKPSEPIDFVIHGDAKTTDSGDPAPSILTESGILPLADRRQSQEATISAMKATLPKG